MSTAEILAAIRHLPEGAQVTLAVQKADLIAALEEQADHPDRVVTTSWCAETLGMSREWWADACRSGAITDAWQETEGSPWYLRAGSARRHIRRHVEERTRGRSRRRGPRKARRAS
jgi:hypothetical protein